MGSFDMRRWSAAHLLLNKSQIWSIEVLDWCKLKNPTSVGISIFITKGSRYSIEVIQGLPLLLAPFLTVYVNK